MCLEPAKISVQAREGPSGVSEVKPMSNRAEATCMQKQTQDQHLLSRPSSLVKPTNRTASSLPKKLCSLPTKEQLPLISISKIALRPPGQKTALVQKDQHVILSRCTAVLPKESMSHIHRKAVCPVFQSFINAFWKHKFQV